MVHPKFRFLVLSYEPGRAHDAFTKEITKEIEDETQAHSLAVTGRDRDGRCGPRRRARVWRNGQTKLLTHDPKHPGQIARCLGSALPPWQRLVAAPPCQVGVHLRLCRFGQHR
ncbi:hypothetical protein D3C72_2184760 [compost metagenome]